MNIQTLPIAFQQVTPVRLLTEAPRATEPWPAGYTMTVWGVGVGVTVLLALIVHTWLRMSPNRRALLVQTVVWRLSPGQLLLLRAASRASDTPASTLLISRGAFESAMAAWAGAGGSPTPRARRSLASLSARVFGRDPG